MIWAWVWAWVWWFGVWRGFVLKFHSGLRFGEQKIRIFVVPAPPSRPSGRLEVPFVSHLGRAVRLGSAWFGVILASRPSGRRVVPSCFGEPPVWTASARKCLSGVNIGSGLSSRHCPGRNAKVAVGSAQRHPIICRFRCVGGKTFARISFKPLYWKTKFGLCERDDPATASAPDMLEKYKTKT